jgi:pilus assembly protein CpaE
VGKNENFGSPYNNGSLHLDCKIKLIVSEEEFGRSLFTQDDAPSLSFSVVHIEAGDAIAADHIGDAEMLVVELNCHDPASMRRLTALRSQRPTLPGVVAMRDADLATTRMLIRQGVGDVISLPIQPDEFDDAVNNLLASRIQETKREIKLAPVVAVAQSVGGIGATTIATHLAHYLCARSVGTRGCCLVDLDLQFGNAASYLGAPANLTMEDLLAAGQRADGELLRTVAAVGSEGVAVIAAPDRIAPLESVDNEQLQRVLHLARQEYEHVVLDLPGNWANWTLSAIDKADLILLVIDLSVGSLRQARRRLALFEETGIDRSRIRIVANRVEKRLFRTINVQDAADALRYPIFATVSSDYAVVQSAHDQGILVGNIARKNRVALDLAALADLVGEELDKR